MGTERSLGTCQGLYGMDGGMKKGQGTNVVVVRKLRRLVIEMLEVALFGL